MAKPLLKAEQRFLNPYEAEYLTQRNQNPAFRESEWQSYTDRGELDMYIQTLHDSDKLDYDAVSTDYDFDVLDASSQTAALMNELYGNKTESKERFKTVYDLAGNPSQVSIGNMTDYDYTKLLLRQQADYEKEQIRLKQVEEAKNYDQFGTVMNTIVAGGAELVEGAIGFVGDVGNAIGSLIGGFSGLADGRGWDQGFRDYFKWSNDVYQLDDWLEGFEAENTYFRTSDGQLTGVGQYVGQSLNSIGNMLPTIALNIATGGSAEILTRAVFAVGSYGSNLADATARLPENVSTLQIMANATLKSAAEVGIEFGLDAIIGKIAKGAISGGKSPLDRMLYGGKGKLTSTGASLGKLTASDWTKRGIVQYVSGAAKEALEESLQETSSALLDKAFVLANENFGELSELSLQAIVDAGIMGAICSGAMSGFQIAVGKRVKTDVKVGKDGKPVVKKSIGDKVEYKYEKLGAFGSYAYNQTLGEFFGTFDDILKDEKSTAQEKRQALGQMVNAYETLAGIYGEIGTERFTQAAKVMERIAEAEKGGKFDADLVKNSAMVLAADLDSLPQAKFDDTVKKLTEAGITSVESKVDTDGKVEQVKKKGRPKKVKTEEESAEPAKKRGRPKKVKTEGEPTIEEKSEQADEILETIEHVAGTDTEKTRTNLPRGIRKLDRQRDRQHKTTVAEEVVSDEVVYVDEKGEPVTQEEIVERVVEETAEEVAKNTGKPVIIANDGNSPVTTETANIVPKNELLNTSPLEVTFDILMNELYETYLSDPELRSYFEDIYKKMSKGHLSNKRVIDKTFIREFFFGTDYIEYVIYNADSVLFETLLNIKTVMYKFVDNLKTENSKQYAKHKFDEQWKIFSANFTKYYLQHYEADPYLAYINGIISKAQFELIGKQRYNFRIGEKIINGEKLTNDEKAAIEHRIGVGSGMHHITSEEIRKGLYSSDKSSRIFAVEQLNNYYNGVYLGKHDGVTYPKQDTAENKALTRVLEYYGVTLKDWDQYGINSPKTVKWLAMTYGKVDPNEVNSWTSDDCEDYLMNNPEVIIAMFNERVKQTGVAGITTTIMLDENGKLVARTFNPQGFEGMTDYVEEYRKGTGGKYKEVPLSIIPKGDVTATTILSEIFAEPSKNFYKTIDDIIDNPSLASKEVAERVQGKVRSQRVSELREYLLSKYGVSLSVGQDGKLHLTTYMDFAKHMTNGDIDPNKLNISGTSITEFFDSEILSDDAKKIKIIPKKLPKGDHGGYDFVNNTITVNSSESVAEVTDTVIHELVHNIQYNNGMSLGFRLNWISELSSTEKDALIEKIRKKFPGYLLDSDDYGTKLAKIEALIYTCSAGEMAAVGFENNKVWSFEPILVRSVGRKLEIVFSDGDRFSVNASIAKSVTDLPKEPKKSIHKRKVAETSYEKKQKAQKRRKRGKSIVLESDVTIYDMKGNVVKVLKAGERIKDEVKTDDDNTKSSERIYISKEKFGDWKVMKGYTGKYMDVRMFRFLASIPDEKLSKLPLEFKMKLKSGKLTLHDVKEFVGKASTDELPPWLFKSIAKNIYQNDYVAENFDSLEDVDAVIDLEMPKAFQFVQLMKKFKELYKGNEILLDKIDKYLHETWKKGTYKTKSGEKKMTSDIQARLFIINRVLLQKDPSAKHNPESKLSVKLFESQSEYNDTHKYVEDLFKFEQLYRQYESDKMAKEIRRQGVMRMYDGTIYSSGDLGTFTGLVLKKFDPKQMSGKPWRKYAGKSTWKSLDSTVDEDGELTLVENISANIDQYENIADDVDATEMRTKLISVWIENYRIENPTVNETELAKLAQKELSRLTSLTEDDLREEFVKHSIEEDYEIVIPTRTNFVRNRSSITTSIRNKLSTIRNNVPKKFRNSKELKTDLGELNSELDENFKFKDPKRFYHGKSQKQILEIEEKITEIVENAKNGKYSKEYSKKLDRKLKKTQESLNRIQAESVLGRKAKNIIIGDERITITSTTEVPEQISDIANTVSEDLAPTYVKGVTAKDVNHVTISFNKFVEVNTKTLVDLTQEDAEKIVKFYSNSDAIELTATEKGRRFYDYTKIMLLHYILAENGKRDFTLSESDYEVANNTLEEFISRAGGDLAIHREAVKKFRAESTMFKSLALDAGVDFSKNPEILKHLDEVITMISETDKNDTERMTKLRELLKEARTNAYLYAKKEFEEGDTIREKAYLDAKKAYDEYMKKSKQERNKQTENDLKEKYLVAEKEYKNRKESWQEKIVKFERIMMLSSPFTWVRNWISNPIVTTINRASEAIGTVFAGKKKDIKGQYKIYGTKPSAEVDKYVKDTFEDTGILSLISEGLATTKYDTRLTEADAAIMADGNINNEHLVKMIADSAVVQLWGEKAFRGKGKGALDTATIKVIDTVHSFISKMLSDNKWIEKAAIRYFKAMLTEDVNAKKIDLSKGLSKNVLNVLCMAYSQAAMDYMHKGNGFVQLEKLIKKQGDTWWFVYKQFAPFASAGWNWFLEGVKLTPVGLISSIVKFTKLENTISALEDAKQKGVKGMDPRLARYNAIRDIGKGVIGTIGFVIGILLAAAGFAKIDEEDDKIKLVVGDVKVDISTLFGTQGIMLGLAIATPKDENFDFMKHLAQTMDIFLQDSIYSDVIESIRYSDGLGDFILDSTTNAMGMLWPNFIKMIATMVNQNEVQYESGFIGNLQRFLTNSIPFAYKLMPLKYDPYTGELKPKHNLPWYANVFNQISPVKVYPYSYSDIENLSRDVGANKTQLTGRYSDIGNLSKSDVAKLNEYYGKLNRVDLEKFFNDKTKYYVENEKGKRVLLTYSKMNDKQKKNVIERITFNNATISKIYIYTSNGGKYYASDSLYKSLKSLDISNVYRETSKLKGFK